MTDSPSHPKDPLHGVTLETVLKAMVEWHGWETLGQKIPVRCFLLDPSIRSSLTFLRKTPWARKKLEDWYVYELRRQKHSLDRPKEGSVDPIQPGVESSEPQPGS
jgi:uncharacterized protein (DUF2132 family)